MIEFPVPVPLQQTQRLGELWDRSQIQNSKSELIHRGRLHTPMIWYRAVLLCALHTTIFSWVNLLKGSFVFNSGVRWAGAVEAFRCASARYTQ